MAELVDENNGLVPQATFRRARTPAAKAHRHEAILTAAERLARDGGIRSITLTDLGEAVGLAKSNVLNYFGSREEIFLELTTRQWNEWASALGTELAAAGPVDDLAGVIASSLVQRPLFCELASQAFINLEHKVSAEAALTFKRTAATLIDRLAQQAAGAQDVLTAAECRELLDAAVMLAGAVWVVAHPSAKVREIYAQDPDLEHGTVVFNIRFPRALAALAAGLPTLRG
ncbi:TetR family transcriptional regulator [Streptacidiphilus sp. PAMC 29251]